MPSIGIACNFFNEVHALPGFLENASSFFDDMVFMDSGPEGIPSDDGSLDILRSWGITPLQGNVSQGFGCIRTSLIRSSKTDWVWIADADERFFPVLEVLGCDGTERYPSSQKPLLSVRPTGASYHQGKMLRSILEAAEGQDALVGVRRHWFDLSMRKPCQNWYHERDFQCRCLRNVGHVGFKPEVRMHEKIVDFRTGGEPNMIRIESPERGIFWDHFHCHFKPLHAGKNKQDMATYKMLDEGGTREMWLQNAEGVKA